MATEVITFRLATEAAQLLREAGIQPAQAAKESLERLAQVERMKRAWKRLDELALEPAEPGTAVRLLQEGRNELDRKIDRAG